MSQLIIFFAIWYVCFYTYSYHSMYLVPLNLHLYQKSILQVNICTILKDLVNKTIDRPLCPLQYMCLCFYFFSESDSFLLSSPFDLQRSDSVSKKKSRRRISKPSFSFWPLPVCCKALRVKLLVVS